MVLHIKGEVAIIGPAGVLNPAYVGFCYSGDMNAAQVSATFLSYLSKAMVETSVICQVAGVTYQTGGPATWSPTQTLPFPSAEMADWHAIDVDSPTPAGWSDFLVGDTGGQATVGSSVNVGEITTIGGRHNGRQFLPWMNAGAVTTGGLVATAAKSAVEAAAKWRLAGTIYTRPAWWSAGYAVAGKVSGTPILMPVTGYVCRDAPARLRSRIR